MSDNLPERLVVILSEAKNLINLYTYAFETLRLTPQNDIVGQPQTVDICPPQEQAIPEI